MQNSFVDFAIIADLKHAVFVVSPSKVSSLASK